MPVSSASSTSSTAAKFCWARHSSSPRTTSRILISDRGSYAGLSWRRGRHTTEVCACNRHETEPLESANLDLGIVREGIQVVRCHRRSPYRQDQCDGRDLLLLLS